MINIYGEKIAIIADLHVGVHSNSEVWHKITLDYGYWLKKELQKQNIKDILILGDIFNNREEIGVNTLSVAEQFFKILTDPITPFNIILLNGNHDSYLRDSSKINSISIFKGWKNITVIDEQCNCMVNGKTFQFAPWGTSIDDLKQQKSDIIFGHMEINTFKKNISKLCEDGFNSSDLLKISNLIISGHFHLRDEREYNNGKIIYVGSTYSQTWNDNESIKGYYILDTQDLKTEFHENTISPRYYRIKLSDFFDKVKIEDIKKIIPNNFIKIHIDKDIGYDNLEKIMNIVAVLKPMELSSDFSNDEKTSTNENYESVHLDMKSLLTEFISSLDIGKIKDKVLKEMEEIYNKTITKVKIENE